MSNYEEAKRCPKCEQPGAEGAARSLKSPHGARLLTFSCRNSRCKWFDTNWTVQVNADGTIPPPTLTRDKQFAKLPDDGGRTAKALERQYDLEQKPGTEVRNS